MASGDDIETLRQRIEFHRRGLANATGALEVIGPEKLGVVAELKRQIGYHAEDLTLYQERLDAATNEQSWA